MGRKEKRGLRITDRDLHLLTFVTRHGFATAAQIGLWSFSEWEAGERELVVSMSMVYRRLGKLVSGGLLRHEYVLHGRPGVYLATRRCADFVDAGVPPAKVDLKSFDHDLAVVDLALSLEGLFDWLTEREIRARAVSAVRGRGGKISRSGRLGRVPDGLLLGYKAERWAVELEISGKDNARYLDIFRAYADKHRERMPEGDLPSPEEALADYVESRGELDGVAWYFRSDSKRERAREAARKVIREVEEEYPDDAGNLRFFFGDAADPRTPPSEKWDEQVEEDEREERERRRQAHEDRKREHLAGVKLTAGEADQAVEEVYRLKNEGKLIRKRLTEEERSEALRDALEAKRARERAAYPGFEG